MEEETPLLHKVVFFQMPEKGFRPEVFLRSKYFSENYLFLKNYVTSEEIVSHNVLYYQQLFIALPSQF